MGSTVGAAVDALRVVTTVCTAVDELRVGIQLMDNELAIVGTTVDRHQLDSIVGAAGDGLQVGSIESTVVDGQ